MKKSESISRKETPEEELKRLRKENQSWKSYLEKVNKQYGQIKDKLKASKDKLKAEKKALKAELKKKTSRRQPWAKSRKNYFWRCSRTLIFASGNLHAGEASMQS